jgi:hypothetical protein
MGPDERVEDFDRWSRGRGLVARDVDRKRVARELFDIAAGEPVGKEHIETLIARYREGLMGAHSVLLARRVGEELLTWQKESPAGRTRRPVSEAPRALSDRPDHRSEPPERHAGASSFLSEPPRMPSEPPRKRSDAPPRKWSDPPDHHSGPPEPPLHSDPPLRLRSEPPSFGSDPPRREPMIDKMLPPPRGASEPDGEEAGFEARRGSKRARPRDDEDIEDIGGAWLEAEEERPRATSRRPERFAESVRPRLESGSRSNRPVDLDDEPRKFKAGRDHLVSVRPAGAPRLPDVEMSTEGVLPNRRPRGDDLTDSIAPPPPPIPASALGSVTLVSEPTTLLDGKRIAFGLLALIVAGVLALVLTRPGCILAGSDDPVQGNYVSEHLGLSMTFAEPWKYAGSQDAEEERGPWERRVSIFYRGGDNHNDASNQLTIVVFDSTKALATDTDARQLGANEVMGMATRRRCDPIDVGSGKGTRCFSLSARPGRAFGVVEWYYPLEGKAIFARAMIELPMFQMAQSPDPEAGQDFERELIQNLGAVEAVVDSIKIVPKK